MSTRLETARLVIRTFEPRDAEAWLAMFADPEVRRFLPGPAPTMEDFHRAIEGRHGGELVPEDVSGTMAFIRYALER